MLSRVLGEKQRTGTAMQYLEKGDNPANSGESRKAEKKNCFQTTRKPRSKHTHE